MSKYNNTITVNLLAGPGCGKSTFTAAIFSELKWKGVDCEIAPEYAKDLVWEQRYKTFENQIYLFGKQHHRIFRLQGQVEVVITDSPILLTPIYDNEKRKSLKDLVFEEYYKMNNLNVFLQRKKEYNPNGRKHNEDEAKELDNKIYELLRQNQLPFMEVQGNTDGIKIVVDTILSKIRP